MYDPEADAWMLIDAAGRKMLFLEYPAAIRAAERYGGAPEALVRKTPNADAPTPAEGGRLHQRPS